jgi:hypothetical protein
VNRRMHGRQSGPRDRIAAFAEATEVYAESLEDPDLAKVYWGKSLGLWQAVTILAAEDRATPVRPLQGPSTTGGPGGTDSVHPCPPTRPVAAPAAAASPGR